MDSNKDLVPTKNGTSKQIPTIPKRLLKSYLLATNDPDILEATDDIALLIARRDDLLAKLEEGEFGPKLWTELRKTFERFNDARRRAARGSTKAAEQMANELDNLEKLIAKGYHEDLIWQELINVLEQRRRLSSTEIRRRERAEEVITKEQFKALLGYIINSVQMRVSNKDEAMAILADIQNLQL